MHRHVVLVSCLATIAVVVPAGWTALDADIRTDGKLVRPLQKEVEIGGARVTLDVDRSVIVSGDSVIATLRAYADEPTRVVIDVVVQQSNSEGFSRVAPPPVTIDRETITLAASPDGGPPVQTRIKLGKQHKARGVRDTFRIIAAAHAPKRKFGIFDDEGTAQASITGFSGNELGLRVVPETVRPGEPAVVAVHITNTTKVALRAPRVNVAPSMEDRYSESIQSLDEPDAGQSIDDTSAPFTPGMTIVRRFQLPAPARGATEQALVVDVSAMYPQTAERKYDDMMGWPTADSLDVVTVPVTATAVAEK